MHKVVRLPAAPPDVDSLLSLLSGDLHLQRVLDLVGCSGRRVTHEGRYLHWDELRHRQPPNGLSHEDWWAGLKFFRRSIYRPFPLRTVRGGAFVVAIPDEAQGLLHDITRRAGGSIVAPAQILNPETRDRYLIRNLMEEGITSSLLEGASTTRDQARDMLRAERAPRTEGERMVLNNYLAMRHICDHGQAPLTPDSVFELHRILTEGTLKDPDAAGRLRRADEQIDIVDPRDNTVLHVPPPARELSDRMKAMCAFANGETPDGFVDPVVRSIVLHFWLAYDHPFKDGNGRCARALFYWSMLRHDYWLCQFISISDFIYRAPSQYARAFLFTESDDNDLTYFVLHQLHVIRKAIDALHAYIDEKASQRRELEKRTRLASVLNERQIEVVTELLRRPNAEIDFQRHKNDFGIVYQTARTDLLGLAEKGLLIQAKRGRAFYFSPPHDLAERLAKVGAGA